MRYIRLFILLLLIPFMAHAEHVFEAGARIGLAGYNAQCIYVSPVPNVHAGFQLSYTYHSSRVIGFRAGITLDRHKAAFSKTDYTDSYTTVDVENEQMQIDYSISKLRETYTGWSVGIPLQLAFRWSRVNLYLGPKIVFPFRTSWRENADHASLSVYYPKRDNRVYESYPLAASSDFREAQSGAVSATKIQWWLSGELSYDIPVYIARRYKSYVSIALYADYSFTPETDPASNRESLLMLSDTRDGFPLHRMMTTVVTANRQGRRVVTKRNLFDVGIKLSYLIAPYDPYRQSRKMCRCDSF